METTFEIITSLSRGDAFWKSELLGWCKSEPDLVEPFCLASNVANKGHPGRSILTSSDITSGNMYIFIHPASRGGPPTPPVFWFGPCKDIEHTSTIFLKCFLIVFLQHPRNLYIFGHKVGPKNRFLQCCFNLFFKNNIIYAFFNIKLVQNTSFCSVFNTLASQIL